MSDEQKIALIETLIKPRRGFDLVKTLGADEVDVAIGHLLIVENGILKGLGVKSAKQELDAALAQHRAWQFAPVVADADLEAQARSGNLTAHGRLLRDHFGGDQQKYADWCAANGDAKPGKVVAADNTRKASSENPWSREGWSLKRQGELCIKLGTDKAGAIAGAAGCVIGSTKFNPMFN